MCVLLFTVLYNCCTVHCTRVQCTTTSSSVCKLGPQIRRHKYIATTASASHMFCSANAYTSGIECFPKKSVHPDNRQLYTRAKPPALPT